MEFCALSSAFLWIGRRKKVSINMEIIENRKSSYTYKDNPDINPDIFTETPSIYRINPDMNPDILCSLSPFIAVSYTHLRAHETDSYLVCRLLLEKKKK